VLGRTQCAFAFDRSDGLVDQSIFAVLELVSVALLFAAALTASAAPSTEGRSLVFDAYRGPKKIGTHRIQFTQRGPDLLVDVKIELKGRVLFVPFRYTHYNREVWRGDELVRLDSDTVVNDKSTQVNVRRLGITYQISVNGQSKSWPGDAYPTSYWNPDTPNRERWLNTQKGDVTAATVEQVVPVSIPYGARKLAAKEYRMTGKIKVNLAYDAAGCLIGMNFRLPMDGQQIVYRLMERPTLPPIQFYAPVWSLARQRRPWADDRADEPKLWVHLDCGRVDGNWSLHSLGLCPTRGARRGLSAQPSRAGNFGSRSARWTDHPHRAGCNRS
jgi:Family of unknown function (DUF6134)